MMKMKHTNTPHPLKLVTLINADGTFEVVEFENGEEMSREHCGSLEEVDLHTTALKSEHRKFYPDSFKYEHLEIEEVEMFNV